MHHRLTLLLLCISFAWTADAQAKAEQWYKADLALIDVTLSDDQGGQTYVYLNSKGDLTIRVDGKEKRGTLKLAKDKTAAAFVLYIWNLPSEKMAVTKISAHIQRRIGNDTEHLIRSFASADETKELRGHLDALVKSLR